MFFLFGGKLENLGKNTNRAWVMYLESDSHQTHNIIIDILLFIEDVLKKKQLW